MVLMDSDVAIDLLRNHPPALSWLIAQKEIIGLPGFVVLELVSDCRNKVELQKVHRFLAMYPIIWGSDKAMMQAVVEFASLRLSHNVGVFDAVIAATAMENDCVLLTSNNKHFSAVPGLVIKEPYVR